jgi:hypothetical protein
MAAKLSGADLIQIKKLMGRIVRQYYNTDDIVMKSELEEKYKNLQAKIADYKDVKLTPAEEQELSKLDMYTKLFEEYNTTNNIVRKAEIEEIFKSIAHD